MVGQYGKELLDATPVASPYIFAECAGRGSKNTVAQQFSSQFCANKLSMPSAIDGAANSMCAVATMALGNICRTAPLIQRRSSFATPRAVVNDQEAQLR